MGCRERGLGDLSVLPDELLCDLLERLEATTLVVLSRTSKIFRIFCLEQPLWQAVALRTSCRELRWTGTWDRTALAMNRGQGLDASDMEHEGLGCIFPVPGFTSGHLYSRWYRCHMDVSSFVPIECSIDHLNGRKVSPQQFEDEFDGKNKPVILTNIQSNWSAMGWTLQALKEQVGEVEFAVNCPLKKSYRMKLYNFIDYMKEQNDEDPLYLFDEDFGTSAPGLLEGYEVPMVFRHDFYNKLGSNRPPYQWLLIGPPRSGSVWHIDPLATSAWNSLISGRKRWALYPPGRVPPGVVFSSFPHPSRQDIDFQSPSALSWFLEVLPCLTPELQPLQFVQEPGETVFIPAGWWHCVLNLETSIAVTQNFVSLANLEDAVGCLAFGAHGYLSRHYMESEDEERKAVPPVLGCRWLGDWMSRLWSDKESEGALRDTLWKTGCKIFNIDIWYKNLCTIFTDLGLPTPDESTAFPLTATSNWIFKAQNLVIKVYVNKVHMGSVFKCCVEETVCHMLNNSLSTKKPDGSNFPYTLGCGFMEVHSQGDSTCRMLAPYLVTSFCQGTRIDRCSQRHEDEGLYAAAKSLGKCLSRIHNCPVHQGCAQSSCHSTLIDTQCKGSKRTTLSFSDGASAAQWCKSIVTRGFFWQPQDSRCLWSSVAGFLSFKNEPFCDTQKVEVDRDKLLVEELGAWYPFVSFLRWRRSMVVAHHHQLRSMPCQLIEDLDAYLPDDPYVLLQGCMETPCWLHGDATHDNVLLSEDTDSQGCSVKMIDFGDAGHGDPIYDFVAASISTLRCQKGLLHAFRDAYLSSKAHFSLGKDVERMVPLSKVATCYMLLHEDDPVYRIFELRPDLREVQTLTHLQIGFWGFLDDKSECRKQLV